MTLYDFKFVAPRDESLPPLMMYLPKSSSQRPLPTMVSVHGYTRQPLDHARAFAALAEQAGMALLLPLFDEREHRRYQQLIHPRRGIRSDAALLRMVDAVAAEHALDASRLYLFGYSGGGQFVHRFALLHPERTAALAVGAAGWYTWLDAALDYPLGTAGMAERFGREPDVAAFLRRPMRVWVGDRDTVADAQLHDQPEVSTLQGGNRFERGRRWVNAVHEAAAKRGIEADAAFESIPGVGHDFQRCAQRGGLAERVMQFFSASKRS